MLSKNLFVIKYIILLMVLVNLPISTALSEGFKRFYYTGLGECSDCDYHGRDYQWCKTGPGPDDWMHCSTEGGMTSRGKHCRADHRCHKHGKEFLWCFTEEGREEKAWDYCAHAQDTNRVPYTLDEKECFSLCKKRDGKDKLTCRTKSGDFAACKPTKKVSKSDQIHYTYGGEKCQSACKKRDGDEERMCKTPSNVYDRCRPSKEEFHQEADELMPKLLDIYRASISPEENLNRDEL